MRIILFFILCLFEISSSAFGAEGTSAFSEWGTALPPGSPLLFGAPGEESSSQPMDIRDDHRSGEPSQRPFTQAPEQRDSVEESPPASGIPQQQYRLTTTFRLASIPSSTTILFSDPDIKYTHLLETRTALEGMERREVTTLALSGILEILTRKKQEASLFISCNGPLSQHFYTQLLLIIPHLSELILEVWSGDEVFMNAIGFIDSFEQLPTYAYTPGEETLRITYPVRNFFAPGSPLAL